MTATITATPLMMPRRQPVLTPTTEVVYTTTTGDTPRPRPTHTAPAATDTRDTYDPFCFVCSRCTDHVGEHDALADAGLIEYGTDGVVRKTAAWDDEQARTIAVAEYAAYTARLGL